MGRQDEISEVLAQPTVEFAGPLPSAIQNYTQFAPGIVTGSSQTDAARALVTFLSSPAAQTVLNPHSPDDVAILSALDTILI